MGRKNKQYFLPYFYGCSHQALQLLSWGMLLKEEVLNDSGDNDFVLPSDPAYDKQSTSIFCGVRLSASSKCTQQGHINL